VARASAPKLTQSNTGHATLSLERAIQAEGCDDTMFRLCCTYITMNQRPSLWVGQDKGEGGWCRRYMAPICRSGETYQPHHRSGRAEENCSSLKGHSFHLSALS
jgi:hypothetical protein